MQQDNPKKRGRGRRPASELAGKREQEIAALAATVAQQKKRLDALKEAQRRAQKAARRSHINQRKYAVGGLAQIAGLLEADAGFVLGAMLSVSDQRRDGTWPGAMFEEYKHRGDQVLADRAAARKGRKPTDDDEDVEFDLASTPVQEPHHQEGAP